MRRFLLDMRARLPHIPLRRAYLLIGITLFALVASLLALGAYNYLGSPDDGGGFSLSQPNQTATPPRHTGPQATTPEPSPTPQPSPGPVLSSDAQIVIEAIGVNAPLITLGLDANAIPQVPQNGQEVTWYDFSAAPGSPSNAVFAGHVSWQQQPAVFWNLGDLQAGDTVVIRDGGGQEFVYEVFANFLVDPDNPDAVLVMAPTNEPIVTLITCGGSWVPDPNQPFGGDYTDRVVVQARLIHTHSV